MKNLTHEQLAIYTAHAATSVEVSEILTGVSEIIDIDFGIDYDPPEQPGRTRILCALFDNAVYRASVTIFHIPRHLSTMASIFFLRGGRTVKTHRNDIIRDVLLWVSMSNFEGYMLEALSTVFSQKYDLENITHQERVRIQYASTVLLVYAVHLMAETVELRDDVPMDWQKPLFLQQYVDTIRTFDQIDDLEAVAEHIIEHAPDRHSRSRSDANWTF